MRCVNLLQNNFLIKIQAGFLEYNLKSVCWTHPVFDLYIHVHQCCFSS